MREGWEMKKLGEVCEIRYGHTAKSSTDIIGPKYLRITDIQDNNVEWDSVPNCPNLNGEFEKYKLKNGDIVFARTGATTGKSFLIKDAPNAVFASYLIRVQLNSKAVLPTFIYQFFQSSKYWRIIEKGITGSAQGGFNASKLSDLVIPIPPLPEQQRIVSILDKAFVAIGQAKANNQKNLDNAKELFQSKLNNIFSHSSGSGGEEWLEKKLGEVCEVKDGTHDSPKYVKEGIPFVTQKNIRQEGLSLENTRFITKVDHDKFYKRSNVAYGDILISMIGANRGMSCIVDSKKIFSIKNVGLVKENEKVNQHYLLYFLNTQKAINYVKSFSKGGAQEFIGLTELRKFPIGLAPLKEQQKIVSQLNTLSTETKKLETIYQQKLNELEELKKSILDKAFKGELTEKEIAAV